MNSFAEEDEDQSSIKVTSVGTDILRDVLAEFGDKIEINGGSKILTTNLKFAAEVAKPFKESGTSYSPAITIASNSAQDPDKEPALAKVNVQPLDSVKEGWYSHALVHVSSDEPKQVLQMFKWVQYALEPKGIVVVICPKQDSVVNILNAALAKKIQQNGGEDEATVIDGNKAERELTKDGVLAYLLEKAVFERARIRTLERSHLTKGDDVDKVAATMKEELERTLGKDETGKGWSKAFDNALWSEKKQHGGLMMEAQVLIAKKWDQLSA